jgi:hypothetical protein
VLSSSRLPWQPVEPHLQALVQPLPSQQCASCCQHASIEGLSYSDAAARCPVLRQPSHFRRSHACCGSTPAAAVLAASYCASACKPGAHDDCSRNAALGGRPCAASGGAAITKATARTAAAERGAHVRTRFLRSRRTGLSAWREDECTLVTCYAPLLVE